MDEYFISFDLQDDEYLASLQADQEKELKALQEAELRRLEETAAREAALEKQKQDEEERRKKQLEEEVSFCHMKSGRWRLIGSYLKYLNAR